MIEKFIIIDDEAVILKIQYHLFFQGLSGEIDISKGNILNTLL